MNGGEGLVMGLVWERSYREGVALHESVHDLVLLPRDGHAENLGLVLDLLRLERVHPRADGVGVVGGGVGGGVAASAATASAGWRRGDSARGRIPAAGGASPLPRPRHEESNLEPRQLGAAGVDHHRGRSAQPPCQAAPSHGQPGQATAERAAQRWRPNGGVRPEAHTFDSRIIWC